MPAAEDPPGVFRACQAPGAADAGCIGKPGNEAGAEKPRGADPSGVLKRSLGAMVPGFPDGRCMMPERWRVRQGTIVYKIILVE